MAWPPLVGIVGWRGGSKPPLVSGTQPLLYNCKTVLHSMQFLLLLLNYE